MFCKNCGNLISESEKKCPSCGAEIIQRNVENSNPQVMGQTVNQINSQVLQNPLGMKWYSFIINVQLFLSMVFFVGNGMRYLDGSVLGNKEQLETIYSAFPSLKILNTIYGIVQFLFVVFLVVIRHRLVKFKRNAPTLYIINIPIQIILEWAWIIIAIVVSGLGFDAFSSIIYSTVCGNFDLLIYMVINILYFRKRKNMFNN